MDRLTARAIAGGAALAAAAGFGATRELPKLIDGSRAAQVPSALRRLDRPVAGRVRVYAADTHLPQVRSCSRTLREQPLGGRPIVERIGVITRSISFVNTRGLLVGCDRTGVRLEGRIWCGVSAGALYGNRLRDPRLDILCRNRHGRLVGSIWVNPVRGARWIAVDQGSYKELYPTAARLPVRISSARNVNLGHASAIFVVSQYGARGRRLSHERIVAHVAG